MIVGGARQTAARLPTTPGVYRFRDTAGRVLYIGRAVNLRRRVQSYWGDLGDRRHLRAMVPRIVRVEALPCDSPHEAAWLERNLLQTSKPRWNRFRNGGAEKEVWIHLDASPRTPGLVVVHQPGDGHVFGPYLGGQKVRDAVSGLGRVLPLAYTADTALGSEADMARVRGASPEQRAELAARITAVLGQDPEEVDRVRAELVARRDAASAALAFELAGRLHAEIAGLDWVGGVQRVTRPGTGEVTAYGFRAGRLVILDVRNGRLCRWRTREVSLATGTRRAAETPAEWVGFATRAAELAARLDDGAHR